MVVANFISPITLCLGTKGLFAFAVRSYQRLRDRSSAITFWFF